jgi:hypothetical protein
MKLIEIHERIAEHLTPDVLDRWGFSPIEDGRLALATDISGELLVNMLAVECPEVVEEVFGARLTDTGLRPAGGDGPGSLRQILSL